MHHSNLLAEERRARLAAELMLEQVQTELCAANQKIAATNRKLSDEIVVKREEVELVRTQAEHLRDENIVVRTDLERAESAIMIAERRLWDSLETIQDGFAVFDAKRIMVAANRAYLAAFDGLEMVGPGIHYHEMLRLMCEEGIVDLEETNPLDWQMMMAARWDGTRIEPVTVKLWNGGFVKVIDRRTRDGDMVSLGLNITSTMRREAELVRARARAEAANRAKSAFLANMSHEIRTPMNGVIGMADMLTETKLDEEQRLFVETIRNSGEALLVIINDVLDYSKIEAKKLELHPARFDLERCIHEVLMLLQPSAHDKGLGLAVDYDMFMPTEFVGDPGRIRQILTNLAGNAVKFTEDGHVAIRVVGLPVRDGSAYRVHVTVEDTGIGIPRDKVKTIFGEFSQVEDERNRRYDGTGLGLAITKRLVELMQGEIWVDSEVGTGSGFGFHVTMPVADGAETPPISAPEWIGRAIIVDEPQMTRAILSKQLVAMGLPALSVRTGSEFSAIELNDRDVVIFGDLRTAAEITHTDYTGDGPRRVALLNAPLSGPMPAGIDAVIQKPAQRREIVRVLATLKPPAEKTDDPERLASPAVSPSPEINRGGSQVEEGSFSFDESKSPSMPFSEASTVNAAGDPPAPIDSAGPEKTSGRPSPSAEGQLKAERLDGSTLETSVDVDGEPETQVVVGDTADTKSEHAPQDNAEEPAPVETSSEVEQISAVPAKALETGGSSRTSSHGERPDKGWGSLLIEGKCADRTLEENQASGAGPQNHESTTELPVEGAKEPGSVQETSAKDQEGPAQPEPVEQGSASGTVGTANQSGDRRPNPFRLDGRSSGPTPGNGEQDSQIRASQPSRGEENPRLEPGIGPAATSAREPVPIDASNSSTTLGDGGSTNDPLDSTQRQMQPHDQLPEETPRQMRVLAAEDNKTNRLVLAKMLQSLDIDLSFAINGREAVDAFETVRPDVIFTDISMPEMDGKEASRRIREIEASTGRARTPIIAITAHAMAGDAEEILAAGIDAYLTKPLKRSALVDAIVDARPAEARAPATETANEPGEASALPFAGNASSARGTGADGPLTSIVAE